VIRTVVARHPGRVVARLLASLATLTLIAATSLAAAESSSGGDATHSEAPAIKRVPRPSLTSMEYRLSWGLAQIDADRAYARGITGAGVTVAMIDTGIAAQRGVAIGTLSPQSTDLIAHRTPPATPDPHGAEVADIVAAPLDGIGTVGVAYRSTILSIRADIDGSCATQCAVYGKDLARGIDYAVAHGARVIGVPLVGPHSLPTIEAAMTRAAAAGAIIVMAAGNDGGGDPLWPARYAADPRFTHAVIVAGAAGTNGELASWSNRAGVAANRFISAPGEMIVTDCDRKYCYLVSGSSFAVAYVAGALALLLESQPTLAPQDAADVLLRTAQWQHGRRRNDGCGLVDIGHALHVARQKQANAARL
jgi:subtilisin family serine protease